MSKLIISRFPKEVNRKMTDNNDLDFIVLSTLLAVLILIAVVTYYSLHPETEDFLPELKGEPIIETIFEEETTIEQLAINEQEIKEVRKPILSDEEVMARVVHAESKGEKLLGQVLVAYTILNRCDYYSMTVESVVKEPGQYAYDESIKPNPSCYRAVIIAELIKDFIPDLLPDTLMWFQAGDYHKGDHCGKPYIQVGNHYFNYLPESEE